MKTQEEIAKRFEELTENNEDFFGFGRDALLGCLDFEHAQPFVKEGLTREEFDKLPCSNTPELLLAQMRDYMAFAWDKAGDHRGLSASRSIDKFRAWLWVLGEEELLAFFEATNYANYGAPKLAVVCDALEFPGPDSDALRRMARGETCGAEHECGCDQGVVGEGTFKYVGGGSG